MRVWTTTNSDTDWTHTDTNKYYREYKGLELFIKVKRDYGRLYIWASPQAA